MKLLSSTPAMILVASSCGSVSVSVSGFAPVSNSRSISTSSFVPGTAILSPTVPPSSLSSSSRSSTALQMNLFDRFFRVAKSNINLVLSSLEDPEKIMNQAVEDMQKDLIKVRQTYATVTAAQRRLQEQQRQHEAMAEDWYRRAQLALSRGKDDLARQALTRRQVALDEAEAVQKQLDVNGAALDKLYDSMHLLDQKILEAKNKKAQMAARAATAKTTIQVNDMLSGVTGKTSMDAFNRMEQKVEALEAAAEASADLGALSSSSSSSDLEKEFLMLEASASIDKELQQLKQDLKRSEIRSLPLPGSAE